MKKKNLAEPRSWAVKNSVDEVVSRAREVAERDHRGTFANERERDRIASVYARRAADELNGGGNR